MLYEGTAIDWAIRESTDLAATPPAQSNIAHWICDRFADERPDDPAVVEYRAASGSRTWTYSQLYELSTKLSGAMTEMGIQPLDRVAVSLPQGALSVAIHLGALRIGAIVVPIAPVYKGEAMAQRLRHCGAKIMFCDSAGVERMDSDRSGLTLPRVVSDLTTEPAPEHTIALETFLGFGKPTTEAIAVDGDHPAFIFYTSGSSGQPKGVTHGHRLLFAILPGFQLRYSMAPEEDDVYWTPSDWSWLGAFAETVLPALYFGHPIVATPERFSLDLAYSTLREMSVTRAFLAPVILRRMLATPPAPLTFPKLRSVMAGGEGLTPELRDFGVTHLGVPVNDAYGLTECTDLAVGCAALYETPEDAVGRAVPGRRIVILDEDGNPAEPGVVGEIALDTRDSMLMLGYWDHPQLNTSAIDAEWFKTGDLGSIDSDGILRFGQRRDAVLKISGMRVSAEEIETAVRSHGAVQECGVITAEVDNKTIVVAFIKLGADVEPHHRVVDEITTVAAQKVGVFARPKDVRFVAELPATATGKLDRQKLKKVYAANPVTPGTPRLERIDV